MISAWALALPGVHRLELYVEPWNDASWRTAERAGYKREGLLRGWQVVSGVRRDMFMYSRLRSEQDLDRDAYHDQDTYLDTVLIGGREPAVVVVVDYDDGWPARFEALAARVREALGSRARQVEHIGSTAVPGLAAKPVIDMLLVVDDVEDEDSFAPDLVAAGFVLRVREPGHRMFRTPARDVHLHVLGPGGAEAADYLDLRDWLRASPEDRELYAAEKRRLARRGWTDMNYYAEAKTAVVQAILARGRAASPRS